MLMTMGMAMVMRVIVRLLVHVIAHNLTQTTLFLDLAMIVTVIVRMIVRVSGGFRRAIVRMFRMRDSRIKGVRKFGSYIGLLGRIVRIFPAFALQMKAGCRQEFLEFGLTALRAFRERLCTQLLQGIELVATSLAAVIENGHGISFAPDQ